MNTNQPPPTAKPGRLLRLTAVENLTALRKTSIYTYIASKAHGFPAPVRIGARAVAWRESEVLAWIESRTKTKEEGGQHGK